MGKKRGKFRVNFADSHFPGRKPCIKNLRWLVKNGLNPRAERARKQGWRKVRWHKSNNKKKRKTIKFNFYQFPLKKEQDLKA